MLDKLRNSVSRFHQDKPRGFGRTAFWISMVVVACLFIAHWEGHSGHRVGHRGVEASTQWFAEHKIEDIGYIVNWILEDNELTPEQMSRVQKTMQQLSSDTDQLKAEREDLVERAASILGTDPIDLRAWSEIKRDVLRLTAEATKGGLDVLLKTSEVLTAQQRETLIQTWRNRR